MKATAYYMSVSTSQQETKSQKPETKVHAAAQAGPVLWFTDKASGKNHGPFGVALA